MERIEEKQESVTNLLTLPEGTEFYVVNGGWVGKITLRNGVKCVENRLGIFEITENNYMCLDIRIVEDDEDDQTYELSY